MHQVRFQKSTCEQRATTPFLRWNLLVLLLAMLVQAVPPLELEREPQQVLEQAVELVLALRQERVLLVRAQEHLRCHQQLQSRCQREPCHLRQHESR
jgi:hypothetical protein